MLKNAKKDKALSIIHHLTFKLKIKLLINMKKSICILLSGLLSASMLFAQNRGIAENLVWNISGGTLAITGLGAMPHYDAGKAPWFAARASVTKITIGNTVTSIGNHAFYGFTKLTDVSISARVTSIGERAFSDCTALESVSIPERVTSIGNNAFAGCNLKSVSVFGSKPATLVGNNAFPKKKATLTVPVGAEQIYSTTWKDYFDKVVSSATAGGLSIDEPAENNAKDASVITAQENVSARQETIIENHLPEQPMSRCKTMALAGHVEKVTYINGDYVMFDRNGNMTEEKKDGNVSTWQYENPNRYRNGDFYNIEYNETMRMEVWDSGTSERLSVDYEFDKLGRIMSVIDAKYSYNRRINYIYQGTDFLPYQVVINYGDESGYNSVIIETYTYTEIDRQGNWLKCTVQIKQEENYFDWDTETEQNTNKTTSNQRTRTITYYN